jgi:hypothetical protein
VLDTKTFASVLPHLIVLLPSQNKAKRRMERRTQMLWSLRWAEFVGRLFLQESKKAAPHQHDDSNSYHNHTFEFCIIPQKICNFISFWPKIVDSMFARSTLLCSSRLQTKFGAWDPWPCVWNHCPFSFCLCFCEEYAGHAYEISHQIIYMHAFNYLYASVYNKRNPSLGILTCAFLIMCSFDYKYSRYQIYE